MSNPEPHPVSSHSKAVDVLGAIAQAASDLQVPTGMRSAGIVDRLNGAYGAVAELIAAVKEWRSAQLDMGGDPHDGKRVRACNRSISAKDRLLAALSTIGESQ